MQQFGLGQVGGLDARIHGQDLVFELGLGRCGDGRQAITVTFGQLVDGDVVIDLGDDQPHVLGRNEMAQQGIGAVDAIKRAHQTDLLIHHRIDGRRSGDLRLVFGGDAGRAREGGDHGLGGSVVEIDHDRHGRQATLTKCQSARNAGRVKRRRMAGERQKLIYGSHIAGAERFRRIRSGHDRVAVIG